MIDSFLNVKFPERVECIPRERFFYLRDEFLREEGAKNGTVASLESVPIHLKKKKKRVT